MACRALLVVVCCALGVACNKKPEQTPPPPGERISGSERIGWDQQASDAAQLATFRYAIYVDGARSELGDVNCTPSPPAFTCTARLPALTPGAHTLEVASFVSDVAVVESGKSAPLRVTLGSTSQGSYVVSGFPGPSGFEGRRTSNRLPVATEILVDGLRDPRDLALAPDGRVFVAERGGVVRIVDAGRLTDGDRVSDVDLRGGGGLLGLALDRRFSETRHLYVVQTAVGRGGRTVFRVSRYREVNGTLGEQVVLVDEVPAAPADPRAGLRIGPDGMLYIAFDDGNDPSASTEPSSFSGKVLRLALDGSTPRDRWSPIVREGLRSPRGLDWSPSTGTLWVADVDADGAAWAIGASSRIALSTPDTMGIGFRRDDRSAGTDSLMIAGGPSGGVTQLRMMVGRSGALSDAPLRLTTGDGPVRVVAVSPRGEIYVCTDTRLERIGF